MGEKTALVVFILGDERSLYRRRITPGRGESLISSQFARARIRQTVGDNGNRLVASVILATTLFSSQVGIRGTEGELFRESSFQKEREKERERKSALNRRTYISRISFFFFLFQRCSATPSFAFARKVEPALKWTCRYRNRSILPRACFDTVQG